MRKKWSDQEVQVLKKRIDQVDLVCGIDEVGRGPLAGPVTACAIIMPKNPPIPGVADSKKLTEKKREALYPKILHQALAVGIGQVDEKTIDRINIRQATLLAMKEALDSLQDSDGRPVKPDLVVVDAEEVDTDLPQVSLPKADDRIYCVSCASIVAKVYRDREMVEWGKKYPQYEFEKNKGYGTKNHREAIKKYGILPIHRRTYIHGEDLFVYGEKPSPPSQEKENREEG